MARVFGSQVVTTNYEVTVKKPFDARSLVPTYADLLLKDNWVKSGGTQVIAYNGMLVAVANTSDTSKNGLYMLFDINCTTALKSPDVTNEGNWIKIGETSDVGDFADRLAAIEDELVSIDERLTALESEEKVHTYGYRAGFPKNGVPGHMYVAADLKRTYVYVEGTGYVLVGAGFEEKENGDLLINGGTAD